MDPVTALGAAAAIAQFIQMGVTLVSKASDIYTSASGMPAQDEQLEFVITNMSKTSKSITSMTSTWQQGEVEKALLPVIEKCQQLSDKILVILQRTKAKDPNSMRQSAIAALKGLWSDREKKDLKKDADDCRNLLHLQLTLVIGSQTIKQLDELAQKGSAQAEYLRSLHKPLATLQEGVHVSSLGQEAQETLARLTRLSEKEMNSVASRRIIEGLAFEFPELHRRDNAVLNAYPDTFEWIFEEEIPKKQREALVGRMIFRQWLEEGDGTFHISGKPGSGKSTLMKFIVSNSRTRKILVNWAAGRELIIGKFFFWKPGSRMENSIPSMVRTLLYDTLERCPELAQFTFPERWSKVHSIAWQAPVNLRFDDDEILEAFERLIENRNLNTDRCFFFCIDGLDEFQETLGAKSKDLVKMISKWTITAGRDLKVCVSSREDHIFLDNFAGPKGFKLQDLTYDDIYTFIKDKLEMNDDFNALEKPVDGLHRLTSMVANRADGVFLWVAVVTNLLENACDGGDDFSQLERKVNWTEQRVQDLFEQLLKSVDEPDKDRSAQTFAFVLSLLGNKHGMRMSLFRYSLLNDFDNDPFFAADRDILERAGLIGTNKENIDRREKRARKQLYRYCKGLLEVRINAEDPLETALNPHRITPRNNTHLAKCISLSHRDVQEFLMKEAVQKARADRIKDFDIFGAICQTFAAEIASMMVVDEARVGDDDTHRIWKTNGEAGFYVPELTDILQSMSQQESVKPQHLKALDNLDVLHRPLHPGQDYTPSLRINVVTPGDMIVPYFGSYFSLSICHHAAAMGTEKYFAYDVDLPARNAATKDGSLVSTLLWVWSMDSLRNRGAMINRKLPAILRTLLENGAVPNQAISSDCKTSVWELFVTLSVKSRLPGKLDSPGAEMFKVFLDHNADPNISLKVSRDKWDNYIEAHSSGPHPPTNFQLSHEFLSSTRRISRETFDCVKRTKSDLRDIFEYLDPPNKDILMVLLDKLEKEGQTQPVAEI